MRTLRLWSTAAILSGILLLDLPARAAAQTRDRDIITREEIDSSAHRDQDIYSAIRSLRPRFLQPRGNRTMGGTNTTTPLVYVNGVKESGIDALRRLGASFVEEVRYLDPSRAEMEFGIAAAAGAIVVKTQKTDGRSPLEP